MKTKELELRESVRFMTESLLDIDSIAGMPFATQAEKCIDFCVGALRKLGITMEDDIIVDEVCYTLQHYDDYLYEDYLPDE